MCERLISERGGLYVSVLHTSGNMCTPHAYTLCRRVLIVCATSVLAEMGVDRTQRRERVGYARKKEKKFYFSVWEKKC